METIRIETTQNVGITYEAAGIGDRIIAHIIDTFIVYAYLIAASLITWRVTGGLSWGTGTLVFLPFFLYFPLCHIFLDGQTLGKGARDLKVVRVDGEPPSVGNFIIRWLFRLVEVDFSGGMIALVTIIVSGKGQRLGDMAAGTTVVRTKARTELRDTAFMDLAETYEPVFVEAERLSIEDIEMAKEVIAAMRAQGKTVTARDIGEQMRTALEARMGIPRADMRTFDFLRTVVRDYNAVSGSVDDWS